MTKIEEAMASLEKALDQLVAGNQTGAIRFLADAVASLVEALRET